MHPIAHPQPATSRASAATFAAALCAGLLASACQQAQPPASAAAAAQPAAAPAASDAATSAAMDPPDTTNADAATATDACAGLDRMLVGKGYARARDALKAAGYRLVPPEAEEGGAQELAGDPVFCGNQGCTAEYASAAIAHLTLTVTGDERTPQAQWEVSGWDAPECRPGS
ncbi:MAG TPA: hypothetical protein VM619_08295 [Luteimonas sp.]|nr:hypothetical protein [Luteimonas sp.]